MRTSTERPCYKLSVELLTTYKNINELFYQQKRKVEAKKQVCNNCFDDENGNYVVHCGEEIAGRYTVQVICTVYSSPLLSYVSFISPS